MSEEVILEKLMYMAVKDFFLTAISDYISEMY